MTILIGTGWKFSIRAGLVAAALMLAAAVFIASESQAQSSREAAALSLRLNQTEERLRRMTGRMEELTYRLRQMEGRLRRLSDDTEYRFQEMGNGKSGKKKARRSSEPQSSPRPRRSLSSRTSPAPPRTVPTGRENDTLGAGKRDLNDGGLDPARSATVRSLGVIPGKALNFDINPDTGFPTDTPAKPMNSRESYDQAYGLILRRDYAGAEQAFHTFLNRFGSDPLAGNAQYWLGESYYARGLYRDAADAFLAGYTKYKRSSKAPGSLFKLGMTLLKLNQKQAACSSFAEMGRKFPKAPKALKTRAGRERKKAGC